MTAADNTPGRGLVGFGRVVLSLLLALLPTQAAQAGPTTAPVQMWGEVLGQAPAALHAVLRTRQGEVLTRSRAWLSSEDGRTYYSVRWRGDVARPLARAAAEGSLGFESDGDESALPLRLGRNRPLPERVDVRDGEPELPRVKLLIARAELGEEGELTFTAVFSSELPNAVSGDLSWHQQAGPGAGPGETLELAPGSRTVSRLRSKSRHLGPLPPVWTVSWADPNRRYPRLTALARLVVSRRVDNAGTGKAGNAGPSKREGLPRISSEPLTLRGGEYLDLELECAGGDPAILRQLSLAEPGRSPEKSAPFPLSEARVETLPGGNVWLHASWLVPAARQLSGLELRSGAGPGPAGPWTVHYAGVQRLIGPARDY